MIQPTLSAYESDRLRRGRPDRAFCVVHPRSDPIVNFTEEVIRKSHVYQAVDEGNFPLTIRITPRTRQTSDDRRSWF